MISTQKHLLWLSSALALVLSAAGCSGDKSEGEQARALLSRISALDPKAPIDQRKARIEALAALPLTDPELARLRESCRKAHAGLMQAELEQAAALEGLKALEEQRAGAPISPEQGREVAERIERSEQALSAAAAPFDECGQRTRELTVRYR